MSRQETEEGKKRKKEVEGATENTEQNTEQTDASRLSIGLQLLHHISAKIYTISTK